MDLEIEMLKMMEMEGFNFDTKNQLDKCVNDLKNGNNDDTIYNQIFECEKQYVKELLKFIENYTKKQFEIDDFLKIKECINKRYNI